MNNGIRPNLSVRLIATVTLSIMLAVVGGGIVVGSQQTPFTHADLDREKAERLHCIAELLVASGALLADRVQGVMSLLTARGMALGPVSLGEAVDAMSRQVEMRAATAPTSPFSEHGFADLSAASPATEQERPR